ncbi:MAG: hypothetical protein ACFE0Q_08080 [Anaerolineae bacterium]
MFKKPFSLFILLGSLLLVVPIFAQELPAEQDAYRTDIENAFDATLALNTFKLGGEQNLTQRVTVSGETLDQTVVQRVNGAFINPLATYMVIEQELVQRTNGFDTEVSLTQELLQLEEDLYLQFSDIRPRSIASLYPDHWVLFEDAVDDYDALAVINVEQFLRLLDAQSVANPFSAIDIFSEIEQLEDVTPDEQVLTMYRATFDGERMFTDDYLDEAISILNLDAFGIDGESMSLEINESTISCIYGIGTDDGYIHTVACLIDMTITFDGAAFGVTDDIELVQQLETNFSYYDFNVDNKLPDPST